MPMGVNQAITIPAVWACVRIIAETVATLPLFVYRRLPGGGKEKAPSKPLYKILHDTPNKWQTSTEFREILQGHFTLRGEAFAEIINKGNNEISDLMPLHPDLIQLVSDNTGTYYKYSEGGAKPRRIPYEKVFRLNAFGGKSPIAVARDSLGLAKSQERYAEKFFKNDTSVGGVLSHPGNLSSEALENLQNSLEKFRGADNAFKTLLLEEAMTWTRVGMTSEDAQFLQSRKFSIEDIARWFNVPLHMLQHLERMTFNNVEEMGINFVVYTLRPWLVRWEQSITKFLIPEKDKGTLFAEFQIDGLLRGDFATRSAGYSTALQNGWMNRNRVLELENMNPMGPDGEIYTVQLNMMDIKDVGKLPESNDFPPESNMIHGSAESRSIGERQRLAKAYEPAFQDAAQRIVRREVNDINKNVNKYLRASKKDFLRWVNNYYSGTIKESIKKTMLPIIRTYGELVTDQALKEITADLIFNEQFAAAYADKLAVRWIASSRGQLEKIATGGLKTPEEIAEAIVKRTGEWDLKRAKKSAANEIVKAANAFTWDTLRRGGVTKMRWKTVGDNCPLCDKLSGRVVGIEKHFLEKMDVISAGDGKTAPLTAYQGIRHPPLHRGCDCMIVAG